MEMTTMSLGFSVAASELYAMAKAVGPKFSGDTSSVNPLTPWMWIGGISCSEQGNVARWT